MQEQLVACMLQCADGNRQRCVAQCANRGHYFAGQQSVLQRDDAIRRWVTGAACIASLPTHLA